MNKSAREKIERLHRELTQHPHSLCPDAVWHLSADALRDEALEQARLASYLAGKDTIKTREINVLTEENERLKALYYPRIRRP